MAIIPKKRWPAVKFKQKRAITQAEHEAIVVRESNQERKSFYKLAWHLGGSQSDVAFLDAQYSLGERFKDSCARLRMLSRYDYVTFDITRKLRAGETHKLVVSVFDPTGGEGVLHGKKTLHPGGCTYTAVSGIWQTV